MGISSAGVNVGAPIDQAELGDAELLAWRGLVRVHAALARELDAELDACHGLPLSSYEVLRALSKMPAGRMRMAELAEHVLLSRSGMTRLIDRLEREGLVARSTCDKDGRGCYAVLSDHGRAKVEQARGRTSPSSARASCATSRMTSCARSRSGSSGRCPARICSCCASRKLDTPSPRASTAVCSRSASRSPRRASRAVSRSPTVARRPSRARAERPRRPPEARRRRGARVGCAPRAPASRSTPATPARAPAPARCASPTARSARRPSSRSRRRPWSRRSRSPRSPSSATTWCSATRSTCSSRRATS